MNVDCATTAAQGGPFPCAISTSVCCSSESNEPGCRPGLGNCIWAQSSCNAAGSCRAGQRCCQVDVISSGSGHPGWKTECRAGSTCDVGAPFCVTDVDCPGALTCQSIIDVTGVYGNPSISWKRWR